MGILRKFIIFFAFVCLSIGRSKAESWGSLTFLESSSPRFFRTGSQSQETLVTSDVANAILVLLGFSPSSENPSMASKLNNILVPNPFDRPRNVLFLEADGIDKEMLNKLDLQKFGLSTHSTHKFVSESSPMDVEFHGDDLMLHSFKTSLDFECDDECIAVELLNLAAWLGGHYSRQDSVSGTLSVPLKDVDLFLNLSKSADRIFAKEMISLHGNIREIATYEDKGLKLDLPILLMGSFNGIQILKQNYGRDDTSFHGAKLVFSVVAKLFELQSTIDGHFVGVILTNEQTVPSAWTPLFNVKFLSIPSRQLQEMQSAKSNTTANEIDLVRKTIAWSTAVILFIATLLGVYFLLNMPITRDTLLYSNVKLD